MLLDQLDQKPGVTLESVEGAAKKHMGFFVLGLLESYPEVGVGDWENVLDQWQDAKLCNIFVEWVG